MFILSSLKKVALICACLFFPVSIFAQEIKDPETPKNIIKISPLAWIHGQMPVTVESRIGYERVIGRKSSLAVSYSELGTNYPFGFIGSAAISATLTTALLYYGHPAIVWSKTDIKTEGYRYQIQYKKYLSKEKYAPEGFYLSPHYSFTKADYKVEMKDLGIKFGLKSYNRNYNLLFGYQNVLGKHFAIDLYSGLGLRAKGTKIYDADGNYLQDMEKSSPFKISSGFNIGWAF